MFAALIIDQYPEQRAMDVAAERASGGWNRERAGDEWGGKGWMSLTNLGVDGDRQKKV